MLLYGLCTRWVRWAAIGLLYIRALSIVAYLLVALLPCGKQPLSWVVVVVVRDDGLQPPSLLPLPLHEPHQPLLELRLVLDPPRLRTLDALNGHIPLCDRIRRVARHGANTKFLQP